MKRVFPSAFAALVAVATLTDDNAMAFTPGVVHTAGKTRHPITRIQSTFDSSDDKDRIKKAGAGITTQTPGGLSVYDPNEVGKLQGSNTLMDRVQHGASFSLSGGGTDTAAPVSPDPTAQQGTPEPSPPSAEPTETKPKLSTTNLTQLLNGQMQSRFRGMRET